MKLNLGSGDFKLDGYVNIDCRPQHDPDICCKVEDLNYDEETVDEIYASHILEHLDLEQGRTLLKNCYKWLIKGGVLSIVVPDLLVVCRFIAEGDTDGTLWSWLYGRHDIEEGMGHKWGYTQRTLIDELSKLGFTDIEYFTPKGGDGGFLFKEELLSLSLGCRKQQN